MSLQNTLRLIPRYNWDYRLPDLLNALDGSIRPKQENGASFNEVLGGPSVFTTSGRVSLYTILRSLDLPKDSLVGVPLFCCSVVFDAIIQAGFKPRFLDIVSDTYTLSPSEVERKRKELSAVIAVHMFGHPADMDAIKEAAGPLPVIEDCAQSLLSKYKGKVAGSTGTVSFFSFRSGKYISAGEGSAIVSRAPELFAAIREEIKSFPKWQFGQSALHCLSTYVKSAMYQPPWYGTIGFTIGKRMDRKFNLTAKTGFTKRQVSAGDFRIIRNRLRTFGDKIRMQRENAHYYLDAIKRKDMVLPHEKPGCESNYFQFAVKLINQDHRDRLSKYLFQSGIDAAQYLDGIASEAHALYGYRGDCPVSEQCSRTVLTVPVYYTLSKENVAYIADRINSFPNGSTSQITTGGHIS
jgi:perosamine synthetase